jgi:hypothetical protein
VCVCGVQAVPPYERPALTKGYLFPPEKKPARLPVSNRDNLIMQSSVQACQIVVSFLIQDIRDALPLYLLDIPGTTGLGHGTVQHPD